MNRKLAVGSELDSYCGKCKLVLNHVVIAMVDDLPRRVRCLTCNSEHNHKIAKPKTTRTKRSPRATKSSTAAAKATSLSQWSSMIANWDESMAKPYSIYDSFHVNDTLTHSKFGRGIVTEVPGPDKIITLFESGEKMLIHGKQPR